MGPFFPFDVAAGASQAPGGRSSLDQNLQQRTNGYVIPKHDVMAAGGRVLTRPDMQGLVPEHDAGHRPRSRKSHRMRQPCSWRTHI
jgi:hypothetical protein